MRTIFFVVCIWLIATVANCKNSNLRGSHSKAYDMAECTLGQVSDRILMLEVTVTGEVIHTHYGVLGEEIKPHSQSTLGAPKPEPRLKPQPGPKTKSLPIMGEIFAA
jgi:hypothetical protein